MWHKLENSGWVCAYCPGWSVVQDVVHPRPWEEWLSHCFDFIPNCDAILRLEGESRGADKEVLFAESIGIPVFFSVDELEQWAQDDPFGEDV